MKADVLMTQISRLIQDHHDAFRVQLLGGQAGITPGRIRQLIDNGTITTEQLDGFRVPGLDNNVDYYEYVHMVSRVFDDTPPELRHELRRWTPEQWGAAIDTKYEQVWQAPRPEPVGGEVVFERPGVELETAVTTPTAPEYLAQNEAFAYEAAIERAGVYAKRLGETMEEELGQFVADAIADHDDPEVLSLEIMRRTDDWEHNWERVARTEIQGAYNEGRVMSAINNYGTEAQIAKVTETGACSACRSLYRDGENNPKVFTVAALLANGSNVGRSRASWVPTIWPAHPNCRCDTMVVPPGLVVGSYGELRLPEEMT